MSRIATGHTSLKASVAADGRGGGGRGIADNTVGGVKRTGGGVKKAGVMIGRAFGRVGEIFRD